MYTSLKEIGTFSWFYFTFKQFFGLRITYSNYILHLSIGGIIILFFSYYTLLSVIRLVLRIRSYAFRFYTPQLLLKSNTFKSYAFTLLIPTLIKVPLLKLTIFDSMSQSKDIKISKVNNVKIYPHLNI